MKIEVYDIQWDTDGENIELPSKLIFYKNELNEVTKDSIADKITDLYGWCITGLKYRWII